MGKIGNFAYNIGISLNQEGINTHRQTITPTTQTLQNLSPEEQLTITQDNQALLNANEVQRAWEVESGDKVWDQPGVSQRIWRAQQKDCCKAGVSSSDCSAYIWAKSVSRAKNIASILVPTSPEEVVFLVATAGGGYVLKVAGKAGVKVVRSFRSKKELDEAVAEAKRARYNNPQTHREDLARQAGIPRDIINNPASIWGKTTDQIKQSLEMDGAVVTKKPAKRGTSGNGHVYEVKGGSSGIKEFEYHAGGGVHGASYYKIVKMMVL